MSGSSTMPMALCARNARNAHITVNDVTTWSWVNLVNPILQRRRWHFKSGQIKDHSCICKEEGRSTTDNVRQ